MKIDHDIPGPDVIMRKGAVIPDIKKTGKNNMFGENIY